MTIRCASLLAAFLLMVNPALVWAEDAKSVKPATIDRLPKEEWQKLSPEEKKLRIEARKEAYKNMTPEERKTLRAERKADREERYKNATPEERAKIDERKAKFQARMQERKKVRDTAKAAEAAKKVEQTPALR
ncbi:MAG: hypothetical protein SFX19_07040 [Alphaproteobacteria bacterium]|nr:hypothetical protein [Alphaproteobacteria bacterium]